MTEENFPSPMILRPDWPEWEALRSRKPSLTIFEGLHPRRRTSRVKACWEFASSRACIVVFI